MPTKQQTLTEAADQLRRSVNMIRSKRVMLDLNLAAVYGVSVKNLRQQMARNIKRFPSDFAFRLSESEAASLGKNGARPVWAFNDEGSLMLAHILKSQTAAEVSVRFIRALVAARPDDAVSVIKLKRKNTI